MWYDSFDLLVKKIGRTFKLQKEIIKTEINHDEVDENSYMNNKDEWLPYVTIEVICTAFSYGR